MESQTHIAGLIMERNAPFFVCGAQRDGSLQLMSGSGRASAQRIAQSTSKLGLGGCMTDSGSGGSEGFRREQ
jgi:hypothetical protein